MISNRTNIDGPSLPPHEVAKLSAFFNALPAADPHLSIEEQAAAMALKMRAAELIPPGNTRYLGLEATRNTLLGVATEESARPFVEATITRAIRYAHDESPSGTPAKMPLPRASESSRVPSAAKKRASRQEVALPQDPDEEATPLVLPGRTNLKSIISAVNGILAQLPPDEKALVFIASDLKGLALVKNGLTRFEVAAVIPHWLKMLKTIASEGEALDSIFHTLDYLSLQLKGSDLFSTALRDCSARMQELAQKS